MPVQQRPCHWKVFRRGCVCSKGVILLLIWNFFQYYSFSIGNITIFSLDDTIASTNVIDILYFMVFLPYLLYLVIGWIADTWLGRYKMVTVSLYMAMAGVVLKTIAFIVTQVLPTNSTVSVASTALLICGYVIAVVSTGAFTVTMLPYIIDQLVGASAEKLSAAIFW